MRELKLQVVNSLVQGHMVMAGVQDAYLPWVLSMTGMRFCFSLLVKSQLLMASALEGVRGLSATSSSASSFLVGAPLGSVSVRASGTRELLSPGSRWGKVGQFS